MNIHFAPLQGFTTHVYRKAHNQICGGVDYYYTPFVRLEKGDVRNKDLRDIRSENNVGVPTIPQIIFADREELCRLIEIVRENGWKQIDLNMGCPFPMQVRRGRGAGLLSRPKDFEEIAKEIGDHKDIAFSVKMRLGENCRDDWKALLPMMNSMALSHITVHPRLATQMYKGAIDMEAFEELMDVSQHKIVYNGDITSLDQMIALEGKYTKLEGVMIGRGLLSSPTLGYEYRHKEDCLNDEERLRKFWGIHDAIYEHSVQHLQGDSQILTNLHAFWEYPCKLIDKKVLKKIVKSGSLRSYQEGVAAAKRAMR